MSEVAISVNHVSKIYKLYENPMERLKESLGLSKKKKYREHYALRDVDFQIYKGETVGIIGTNGSGKSTVLKIITGVLSPTMGSVEVNGRISALLELGAGFHMEYTGIENIYLNGSMMGFSKEEIDQKLQSILDFADIGDFVYQPVKTYSSGMFVRLAFAVAINIEPEILIVDEALSVGDVFFQAKCYRKFEEFKEAGKTILFVSHDLGSISKYCDRVVLLNKGEKRAEGDSKEMVDIFKKIMVNQDQQEEETTSKSEITFETKKPYSINSEVLAYGTQEASIVDFNILDETGLSTNTIEKGTNFTIQMKVRFAREIKEPIFAYSFKDLRGTEITGTNTMYESTELPETAAGKEVLISFSQRMTLQGGEYLLSLGCTGFEKGRFQVFHRLYDVCSVSVMSRKNTVGFFDMYSDISVQ